MHRLFIAALFIACTILNGPVAAEEDTQSPLRPSAGQQAYPKIVLYSVSWCPHCKEAKAYFNSHDIPYINKDVEADEQYMKELTEKYKSQGVPLIVIGNDSVILKGFNREKFERAIADAREKK